MVDVTANINQTRARRIAQRRIEGFAQQFGEVYCNLARHASFPLVLTPDLLYQIWANFVPEAPWIAVAHVLLSRLCRQVGYEMYEMDIADRDLLLRELKEQFGQERFDELGQFLLDYVAQQLTDDDTDTQDLREAQEWTALAYTKPDEAAQELAQRLSERVKRKDMGEVLRLVSLVESFAEPLIEAGFEPLLVYSRGMKSFASDELDRAEEQLRKLLKQGHRVEVAGVSLEIPSATPQQINTASLKFLPCSFYRRTINPEADKIFQAGQEFYQVDPNNLEAKIRSFWSATQLTMIIDREDFEGIRREMYGHYNGNALANRIGMTDTEFLNDIRVQFEVNQKLEFTLLFCQGNPKYKIPANISYLDIGVRVGTQKIFSHEHELLYDIAVSIAESPANLRTEAFTLIFEAGKYYDLKSFFDENGVPKVGLISNPLPPLPLNCKYNFYLRSTQTNYWQFIGELSQPQSYTEYPCQYLVTLLEPTGILQIHLGQVPYWTSDSQECLKHEGCVFRTILEKQFG
ncbi:hypothetical protein F7734_12315 [Scytonema sp. UIC 10036]|uniref:hypothetical protein n=1 Tax=Scytonema sp. UIC 10036 TaxID=2304196 RepID=UPI0012DA3E72|nr:hypothetical protein [Scytonema sp. UIC 10036]MUG93173.1 hypothetical protein [Scytonema sp. UIC 10036]